MLGVLVGAEVGDILARRDSRDRAPITRPEDRHQAVALTSAERREASGGPLHNARPPRHSSCITERRDRGTPTAPETPTADERQRTVTNTRWREFRPRDGRGMAFTRAERAKTLCTAREQ